MSKRICVTVDAHGVFTGIKKEPGVPFDVNFYLRTEHKDARPEVTPVGAESIGEGSMDGMLSERIGMEASALQNDLDAVDGDREVLVGVTTYGIPDVVRYYPVVEANDGPNHHFVILTLDQRVHIDLTEDDLR